MKHHFRCDEETKPNRSEAHIHCAVACTARARVATRRRRRRRSGVVGGASGRLGRPRGVGDREGDRDRVRADWEEHTAAAAAARGEGSLAGAPSSGEGGGGDRLEKHGCRSGLGGRPVVPSVNVILLPGANS